MLIINFLILNNSDLLVENGILEKIDPEHILLVPNPENLQILVIQIDEQAVPVAGDSTEATSFFA